jgi:hypothetical protein
VAQHAPGLGDLAIVREVSLKDAVVAVLGVDALGVTLQVLAMAIQEAEAASVVPVSEPTFAAKFGYHFGFIAINGGVGIADVGGSRAFYNGA